MKVTEDIISDQNDGSNICKIHGLDLVLKSINCEKYISKFKDYGINQHTILHLTADDIKLIGVDTDDINTIMTAVNVLNKTINLSDTQLSKEAVSKIQSNIYSQLGSIALALNYMDHVISSKNFEDSLIDDYLSSIDAALMLRPYMRAETEETKKILMKGLKTPKKRKFILITSTVCAVCLVGLTLRHRNYLFNCNFTYSNFISKIKIWKD